MSAARPRPIRHPSSRSQSSDSAGFRSGERPILARERHDDEHGDQRTAHHDGRRPALASDSWDKPGLERKAAHTTASRGMDEGGGRATAAGPRKLVAERRSVIHVRLEFAAAGHVSNPSNGVGIGSDVMRCQCFGPPKRASGRRAKAAPFVWQTGCSNCGKRRSKTGQNVCWQQWMVPSVTRDWREKKFAHSGSRRYDSVVLLQAIAANAVRRLGRGNKNIILSEK